MLRLAILASGGGSNLQSILDADAAGVLGMLPSLVIVDRPCGALNRGVVAGIPTKLLDRKTLGTKLSGRVDEALEEAHIDFVALAGWLSILDASVVDRWESRMVNIHPSLLPRHGGPGMYGIRVHRSVLDAGDVESGCSVHYVTAGVDEGTVIEQARVKVLDGDTPETLAARVLAEEHRLYPAVLGALAQEFAG